MDKIKTDDKGAGLASRAQWERPILRRLAANKAEGKGSLVDDGNCNGTGSVGHHSCQPS